MHEQPCQTLWDINHIPEKSAFDSLPFIGGAALLAIPIFSLIGFIDLQQLWGIAGITYFSSVAAFGKSLIATY